MAVNEKIRIKIKGYEHATVDAAAAKIVEAAKRSGSNVSGPIPLPTDKEIITILRATHKYKDSREQFEMRIVLFQQPVKMFRLAFTFFKKYDTIESISNRSVKPAE